MGLLAAPIAVKHFLPPRGGWPVYNNFTYRSTERYSWGATDWRSIYGSSGDGVALTSAAHPVADRYLTSNTAWFLKEALEPGLKKFWRETYDQHSEEWAEVYGPEQLTLFDSINPDSLEDIEISLEPRHASERDPFALLPAGIGRIRR